MIAVETLQFDHDTGAATHDAMNIRLNAAQTVILPEWRRFACVNPENSPAAYSVASTRGNSITIHVSLSCADPAIQSAEVRVPHHVKTQTMHFVGGVTGVVVFELIDPPVSHGHVGVAELQPSRFECAARPAWKACRWSSDSTVAADAICRLQGSRDRQVPLDGWSRELIDWRARRLFYRGDKRACF